MMKDILFAAFMGVIVVCILSVMKGCHQEEERLRADRSAKCFEQTQDKQCWGIPR